MPNSKIDLPAKLSELPPEALLIVLDKLPPEELTPNLFNLNRELRVKVSAIWQNLWKNKFERHFPHVFKTLPLTQKRDWHAEFQKTYQHEYQYLAPSERKLFSLTKENTSESLAETRLKFSDLQAGRPADINKKSLLKWAREIGNKEVLNYCFSQAKQQHYKNINKIPSKDIRDNQFKTFVNQAIAYHQNCDQIVYLMANKKWPSEKFQLDSESRNAVISKEGDSLLVRAAEQGHLRLVHYLLKIQTEIGLKPFANRSQALFVAITEGFSGVALALITADPEAPEMGSDRLGLVLTIQAAISKNLLPVVQPLIKLNPESLNKPDNEGCTPLMYAVLEGHPSMVEYLLTQTGIDIEATMNHPQFGNQVTALYIAAKKGDAEMVRTLLQAGAAGGKACEGFYGIYYSMSMPPIHAAIKKGDLKTIKALIETQPELLNLAADSSGNSPLNLAVGEGHLEIAQYFLEQKGITVGARAIHMAVQRGKLAMVKLLLKNNPNLLNSSEEDSEHFTPLIHAVVSSRLPFVQYLLEQEGIELLAKYRDRTALHLAVHPKVFDMLLAAHAKDNLPLETSKLSSAAQKNPKVLLLDYLAKRKSEPDYNPSFLFFRLPFNWGFSKKEKLAAAEALKAVMFENETIETLDSHKGALNNGRLKGIYHKYLASRELIAAHNHRSPSWPI